MISREYVAQFARCAHVNTISQAYWDSIPPGHFLQSKTGKSIICPWSNLYMPSAKQGSTKYHFKSLWYDPVRNWTHDLLQTKWALYDWPTGCSSEIFRKCNCSCTTVCAYIDGVDMRHLLHFFHTSHTLDYFDGAVESVVHQQQLPIVLLQCAL